LINDRGFWIGWFVTTCEIGDDVGEITDFDGASVALVGFFVGLSVGLVVGFGVRPFVGAKVGGEVADEP